MDFFLSLLTAIGTLWLFLVAINYLSSIFDDGAVYGAPVGTIFMSVIAIGLSFSLIIPVGYERVVEAYAQGARWDSVYVLHIPSAKDFWQDYIPAHWAVLASKRFDMSGLLYSYNVWGFGFFTIGILFLVWSRFGKKGRRYIKDFSFIPIFKWAIAASILIFFMTQILLFLAAYIVGTFIYVGSFWKIVLGLLVLGCIGGGTVKLYDEHGNHVGNLRK